MVEEDAYCIDVIRQIHAVESALNKVSSRILEEHLNSCVIMAIQGNDKEDVQGNQNHNVVGQLVSSIGGQMLSSVGADQLSSVLGSLVSTAGGDRLLSTIGGSVSQALTHQITSQQATTIAVGQSMIYIGPDAIIIQSPKVLINPGEEVAASASLGGGVPTPAE